jgi:hypothetical protein
MFPPQTQLPLLCSVTARTGSSSTKSPPGYLLLPNNVPAITEMAQLLIALAAQMKLKLWVHQHLAPPHRSTLNAIDALM